jgi:hypothetical protein
MFVVNDALVAAEDSAPIAFQLGNGKPRIGRDWRKTERQGIELLAAAAAGPNMVHGGRTRR